jgi:hypothetical protein
MLAMSYMLVPSARPWPLTYLFVAYLAVQTVAWALGWWQRFPVLRTAGAGPDMIDSTGQGRAVALTAHSTRTVPVSLAVMAAGMAYMLVAM